MGQVAAAPEEAAATLPRILILSQPEQLFVPEIPEKGKKFILLPPRVIYGIFDSAPSFRNGESVPRMGIRKE